ncbi:HYR domain-containing protein [Dactylosporangium aurantiacum]|uniref:HYR domain-containing protein n=1 Tax=Dactylosporangium aurantiacum TaxID=35754 RepID=A0A9Q9I9P4_9ACTN|nr:HYR domain-containing protein [Dactylosporangium aurantiacum]UWZ50946.1 HYR domain-containing protein [Dactylosporangium aurantiacum]
MVVVLAAGVPAGAEPKPGVEPKAVERTVAPGESFDVDKVVQTPTILPKPDVVLLVDTTDSMIDAIDNVKSKIVDIVGAVHDAQTEAHFAVASYRDETDGPELFKVHQTLTGDTGKVTAAVEGLSTGGGDDEDEGWINALVEVAGFDYRDDGSPVVVLIGDAPSHDPSNGHSYDEAENALQDIGARVVGVDVQTELASGLDALDQATHLVTATSGQLLNPSPEQVSAAILSGLQQLDVTVTPDVLACDPALSVSFDAQEVTVPSGDTAEFVETVEVAGDAADGATLECEVRFMLGGAPGGPDFVQHITVHVLEDEPPVVTVEDKTVEATGPDGAVIDYPAEATDDLDGELVPVCAPPPGSVFPIGDTKVTCTAEDSGGNVGQDTATMRVVDTTAPTATCEPAGNPAGNPPKSNNPDGFYVLGGKDLVDPDVQLYIRDTGDPAVNFGPYPSGTTIKLTQAPGAEPEVKPGTGDVNYKVRLRGDARIIAVDAADNVSTAAVCHVPPKP